MCTLSLLARRDGGYVLAMNRDERVTRGVARPPGRATSGANDFLAPRDADAGGSWIAVDARGRALCMLNGDGLAGSDAAAAAADDAGAFPSRGALLIELMAEPEPDAVERALGDRLAGGALRFRPFQLVAIAPRPRPHARRLRFDGRALAVDSFAAPCVLTSNGFDPERVARARGARFTAFLRSVAAREPDDRELSEALLELHASHSEEAPDGALETICMHRPEVRSVSTTLIESGPRGVVMRYRPGQPCERARLHELELR